MSKKIIIIGVGIIFLLGFGVRYVHLCSYNPQTGLMITQCGFERCEGKEIIFQQDKNKVSLVCIGTVGVWLN